MSQILDKIMSDDGNSIYYKVVFLFKGNIGRLIETEGMIPSDIIRFLSYRISTFSKAQILYNESF